MNSANNSADINTLSLLCGAMGLVRSADDVRVIFFAPGRKAWIQLLDTGKVFVSDAAGQEIHPSVAAFDAAVSPHLEATFAA